MKPKKDQDFVLKCDFGIMVGPGFIVTTMLGLSSGYAMTFACGTTIERVAVECMFGSGIWATRCMTAALNSLQSSRIMVLSLVSNWHGMTCYNSIAAVMNTWSALRQGWTCCARHTMAWLLSFVVCSCAARHAYVCLGAAHAWASV